MKQNCALESSGKIQAEYYGQAVLLVSWLLLISPPGEAAPQGKGAIHADKAKVIEFWTSERKQQAIPRDLMLDQHGKAYLRARDGRLIPYGQEMRIMQPNARPGGGGGGNEDTTPPVISDRDPSQGQTIGDSYTFTARVTDESGIRSVTFVIRYPDGSQTQSFSANPGANDTWSVTLQGFSDGNWNWWVEAKDKGSKGGNLAVSNELEFAVDSGSSSGGSGGDSGDTVTNAHWVDGGAVQTAVGRLYFEMPDNPRWKRWSGYVCSGTVAMDNVTGRSVIITAAHCVYDDVNKAFARHVLFIPNQDQTTGFGTDTNCGNDPLGCWVPSFGVVDDDWTIRTFPDNIPWDFAFYVVDDTGSHQGASASSDVLDVAAGSLGIDFNPVYADDGVEGATSPDFTHAMGYSYSDDPNFMYCAEDMTTEGTDNWWLPSCDLSGGASGGPWIQHMAETSGSGPIISVNSWGHTDSPGMAGPFLVGTSAECLFNVARLDSPVSTNEGEAGIAPACP